MKFASAARMAACVRVVTLLLAAAIAMLPVASVHGQPYPARPVHLIVPQPPGGQADVLGRVVGGRLSTFLGQSVIVENRGGANGTIGASIVARAPADGLTLLLAQSSNLPLASLLMKDLPYRVDDFAAVGAIGRISYALAVHPRLPVRTIPELVAYARAHPGELNYASSGVASTSNIVFETLKRAENIDMVHIPFNGSAKAVNELASGRVDAVLTDLQHLLPLARDGTLRVIAVAGTVRSRPAPDVATVGEEGYPQLAVEPFYGIVAPAGTPAPIIAKLSDALQRTLETSAVRSALDRLGIAALQTTPSQFADMIRAELGTYRTLIEQAGIEAPN
ncbi:MAG TPA: tripartite tricarboxylate transporter substrate binding protein [Casimicrobiaceae bacterium]|nr:tripartite tricarboxylate transporter substrate binding protein [Casimicrobiaceae bacterium]